jgi:hypothetical protein
MAVGKAGCLRVSATVGTLGGGLLGAIVKERVSAQVSYLLTFSEIEVCFRRLRWVGMLGTGDRGREMPAGTLPTVT